ncbi:MAG: hypothetical protein ACE5KG_07110, partial [Nitrososphaerales archaeon]
GKTIIFSAHNMAQVEYVCDRIAVVNNGRLIAVATMGELLTNYGEKRYHIEFDSSNIEIPAHLKAKRGKDQRYFVEYDNVDDTNALLEWIGKTGSKTTSITTKSDTLEDIFLGLVDKSHDIV